jgi:hypothetical protein
MTVRRTRSPQARRKLEEASELRRWVWRRCLEEVDGARVPSEGNMR